MANNDGTILIDDATLVFRNFAGREGMYNREGDRNFCVLLDDDLAERLAQDGWNVKQLKIREEGDTPQKYLPVSVRYPSNGNRVRPPTIVIITSRGRNAIDEELCEFIDQVDIAKVDLIVRPYEWAVNGATGIKAYLKSLYVTVAEDELALRYRDVPEIGSEEAARAITTGHEDEDVWDAEVVEEEEQKALTS